MEPLTFLDWLIFNKKLSKRAAKDVISRCKRVCKLTKEKELNKGSVKKLNDSEEFKDKSMFIKSQLRRAVSLFCEYEDEFSGISQKESC